MKYDKQKLLNTVHYNDIIAEFHPSHFYSVKDLNINYTKSNLIPQNKNISRDFEKIYSTDITPMFNFSLSEYAELYVNSEYGKCYQLIELNLKNVISYFDNSNKELKTKLQTLYTNKKLNYTTLSYCLKIYEKLEIKRPYFMIKTNNRLFYTDTELAYKKYDYHIPVEECITL